MEHSSVRTGYWSRLAPAAWATISERYLAEAFGGRSPAPAVGGGTSAPAGNYSRQVGGPGLAFGDLGSAGKLFNPENPGLLWNKSALRGRLKGEI
jgi:hypothetical protein